MPKTQTTGQRRGRRQHTRRRAVDAVLSLYGIVLLAVAYGLCRQPAPGLGELVNVLSIASLLAGLLLATAPVHPLFSLRLRARMVLLLVSSTVAVYVLEASLRLMNPPQTIAKLQEARRASFVERARKAGVPFDTRSWVQAMADLERQGRPASLCGSFEAYLHEYDRESDFSVSGLPRLGVRIDGRPVVPLGHPSRTRIFGVANENGYYRIVQTDEHGFCNPPGLWAERPIQIVGVGDSFTEGCEVRLEECFMSRIRERFPRTISLGLGGGGPLTMLACIREYGPALQPQAVLWCFYEGNDLSDLARRQDHPILSRYLDPGFRQDLLAQQEKIDKALHDLLDWLYEQGRRRHLAGKDEAPNGASTGNNRPATGARKRAWARLGQWLTLRRTRASFGLAPQPGVRIIRLDQLYRPDTNDEEEAIDRELLQLFREILQQANAEVQSWGGKLYFVYLPAWSRFARHRIWDLELRAERAGIRKYRGPVLAIARQLDIQVVDLAETFASEPDPLALFPFRLSGHYTPKGNQLVAQRIVEYLRADTDGPLAVPRKP